MTETRNLICFSDVERFLVKSYKKITGGCEFDIEKYGPLLDVAKKILVPSLEKHIIYCLERFVYNDNIINNSSDFYNSDNINNFDINIESKRRFYDAALIIINNIMRRENFLYIIENSTLLTNSRIERIADQLDAVKFTEKNYLRFWNVVNYLDNYDCDFDTKKKYYSSDDDSTEFTGSLSRSTSESSLINDLKNCLTRKKERKRVASNLKNEKSDTEISLEINKAIDCSNIIGDKLSEGIIFEKNNIDIMKLFVRKKMMNRNRNFADQNFDRGNEFDHFNDSISFPFRVDELLRKLRKVDPFLGILKNRCSCYKIDKNFNKKLENFCLNVNNNRRKYNEICLNNITKNKKKKKKGKKLYCDIRDDYLILKFKNSELFSYTARIPTNKFAKLKNHRRYFNKNNLNPIVTSTIKKSNDRIRISDIIQRLELSPYRFEEAEESLKLRSKIREIVRSIILCNNKNDPNSSVLSVEAVVEDNSISETSFTKVWSRSGDEMPYSVPNDSLSKNNGRKFINEKESTFLKEKSSEIDMSFPKDCGKSGDGISCTVLYDSVTKKNGEIVDNDERKIICDNLSSKNRFEIDLTVEIEDIDSDKSSTSLSRHTHLLPSMITVGLSCGKRLKKKEDIEIKKSIIRSSSSNWSKSRSMKALKKIDVETSMGKSMKENSNRGTISERSYKKICGLMKEENLLNEKENSCSNKYSMSIKSSNDDIKSRRILPIRNEISESSSSSMTEGTEKLKINERTLFSELSSTGSFCCSSKCANFDLRSMRAYACVDDRISNKRLENFSIDDYDYNDEDDEEESFGDKFFNQSSNDGISCSCSNLDSFYNKNSIENDDDEEAVSFNERGKKSDSKSSSSSDIFYTFDQFNGIGRHPVATRWSTCAIRSESPVSKIREFEKNDDVIKSARFIKYKYRNKNRFNKHCGNRKFNFNNKSLIGVIADFNYKKLFNKIDVGVAEKILKCLKFFKNH